MTERLVVQEVCFEREAAGRESFRLDRIDCAFIRPGISLVTGESGSGKTTLLYLISGMLRPDSGDILLDGQSIVRGVPARREQWRSGLGFVFQTPRFLPDYTVLENTMIPMVPGGMRMKEIQRAAGVALERVGLSRLADAPIETLSGGELQLVALARAIAGNFRWLVADEPTAHQDRRGADIVAETLESLATDGCGVIVSSHDDRLTARLCAVACFEILDGRLILRR